MDRGEMLKLIKTALENADLLSWGAFQNDGPPTPNVIAFSTALIAALRASDAPEEGRDRGSIENIAPVELEVTGPYHYPHDVHPCLRIGAPGRIFASLYIVDGDEERAVAEAQLLKEAFRLGGKEIDRIHYASALSPDSRKAEPIAWRDAVKPLVYLLAQFDASYERTVRFYKDEGRGVPPPYTDGYPVTVTMGDLRKIRAALTPATEDGTVSHPSAQEKTP